MILPALTDATREALEMLRDPATFQWSTITLFVLVIYIYANEIGAKRIHVVLAGLAFWLWDLFNEIVNSLVLHFSDRAPLWAVNRETSYLILIGLCVEIALMFLILPIAFVKTLPDDKEMKIRGIPNRWFFIVVASIGSVLIEVVLNALGALQWEYWWWNWPFIPIIVLVGYIPFYWVAAKIYDLGEDRRAQLRILGMQAAVVGSMAVVFGPVLNWI